MFGLYTLILAAVPILLWYAYSTVFRLRFKQYEDLPRAPPSLIWGHLATIGEFYKKGDSRRHIDYVFRQIGQSVGMPPILILDMRPFFWIMCLVFNHDVAEQISRSTKSLPCSTPKSPTMGAFVPIVGSHSIIGAQGETWKSLRRRYNAGFAPSHLMTLLPRIVEKTTSFLHNLDTLAKSEEEFSMEPLCTNLTFDIIGAVVMDVDLNAQLHHSQQSELVKLYRQLLQTYSNDSAAGFLTFHPLVYLRRKRTSRAVDQLLKTIIQDKFAAMTSNTSKDRSVLALSLQGTQELNPLILQQTADQLKSFLFAGHDTTSIVLQWAFYELSRSPSVLATLRAEHDEIFGPDTDPTVVSDILCAKGDEMIPKLTYTSAVIKEILRLYPPASTARRVVPGGGFFVRLPDGRHVCLDGMVLYNMHFVVQRDPAVYGPTSETFMPERWLGDVDTSAAAANPDMDTSGKFRSRDDDETKTIPPSAWRAFERGPRNCIGQELANIEARVILALAVRRYDFEKVGAGRLRSDAHGDPVLDEVTGQYEVETPLFNTRQVTSKPFDGTMMKVRLRS
ncbi:cytochrome P450 [Delphinella strobiligena]|nr:cytochrome P450 [Delphinella strobiligena]